jgi:hypothetical protein
MNESLLSKFESDNMNRNNKSTGKINIYNLEENEAENPLLLNYNYDRRYKSLIDEINYLKDENSGLKGMLERKKVRILRSRKYWKEWKNNWSSLIKIIRISSLNLKSNSVLNPVKSSFLKKKMRSSDWRNQGL